MSQPQKFSPPSNEVIRERLKAVCANRSFDGFSMVVVHQGQQSQWSGSRASGIAEIRDDRNALRVPIGCMIKLYSAAGIVQYCLDSGISLDQNIGELIESSGPREFFHWPNVSLRQLLNSTHGLDDPSFLPYARKSDRTVDIAEIVERSTRLKPLFKPGTAVSYSDGGIVLAAAVVEALSGQPFFRTLIERLLDPLELQSGRPSLVLQVSTAEDICPSLGGSVQLSALDLATLASCSFGIGKHSYAEVFATMLKAPVDFPSWSSIGAAACLGWFAFEGGWYGYTAAQEESQFSLVRFNVSTQSVIAIVSTGLSAYHLFSGVFGGLIPECGHPKAMPRMLAPPEAASASFDWYAGLYECGALRIKVNRPTPNSKFSIALLDRFSEYPVLDKEYSGNLLLAENGRFFSNASNAPWIGYGKFIAQLPHNDLNGYLWNGRQLWRKIANN